MRLAYSEFQVPRVSNCFFTPFFVALLVVGVSPFLFMIGLLLELRSEKVLRDISVALLHLPVGEDLLPAVHFHLEGHLPLGFGLILFFLLKVLYLLVTD